MTNPSRPTSLSMNSSIGEFPPAKYSELCRLLNPMETWKKLAAVVPNRQATGARFTADDVFMMEHYQNPAEHLLNMWSTDHLTLGRLVHWLSKAELERAAVFVRQVVTPDFKPSPNSPACTCGECAEKTYLQLLPDMPSVRADTNPSEGGSLNQARDVTVSVNGSDVIADTFDFPALHVSYDELSKWTGGFDSRSVVDGGSFIGEGGYAIVFKGRDPVTGRYVAVKQIKPQGADVNPATEKHSAVNQWRNEIQILSRLNHDCIVKLFGYSTGGPYRCIVFEYMASGSLEDRLACRNSTAPLNVLTRLAVAHDTARGLIYLHSMNYIHRDIKSANILLDENLRSKISDCGIARSGPTLGDRNTGRIDAPVISPTSVNTEIIVGTTVYMAPEVLFHGRISVKTDAYSFGVVLLELLTGLPSFDQSRDDPNLVMHVESCEADVADIVDQKAGDWRTNSDPQRVYETALRLVDRRYKTRPTVGEVFAEIESWLGGT